MEATDTEFRIGDCCGSGTTTGPESGEIVENQSAGNSQEHNLKMALNVQPPSDVLIVSKNGGTTDGNGSVGSGSFCSQRSKLRLHLELNLQPRDQVAFTGPILKKESESEGVLGEFNEPVSVMVDYPEDMKITVNARIQKIQFEPCAFENPNSQRCSPDIKYVDEVEGAQWRNESQNEKIEVLNSTFVKPTPLTSTLIYPILEGMENEDDKTEHSRYFAKSGSGDVSLYQTVMGDNGFGNLSAISVKKMGKEDKKIDEDEFELDDPLSTEKKQPTLSFSAGFSYLTSHKRTEKLSPSKKLMKALHILAKYRGVWGIYEDEGRIVEHLRKLNEILSTTDDAMVQKVCREDDYQEVRGLVSYFVLEKRFIIRSELLKTFTLLIEKSNAVANYIFASEFPVVLAWEIAKGNYVSKETYEYAYCFHQVISSIRLTKIQCESTGAKFYSQIMGMWYAADKNHYYWHEAELFFEIILLFHGQLDEDSDFKWKCLYVAATPPNRLALKKYKLRLINSLTKDPNQSLSHERKIRNALLVLKDLIICDSTKGVFSNAELDLILVTLTNALEENHAAEYNLEALKTVYRILVTIQKEPSGLNELRRLVKGLLKEEQEAAAGGDRNERNCYWGILKKIYKIITM